MNIKQLKEKIANLDDSLEVISFWNKSSLVDCYLDPDLDPKELSKKIVFEFKDDQDDMFYS